MDEQDLLSTRVDEQDVNLVFWREGVDADELDMFRISVGGFLGYVSLGCDDDSR